MKKYIDIQVVREIETVLDDITLPVNTGAFQVVDIISITEKMDGANASIRYDEKEDVLRAFSRNNELSKDQNLRGFCCWVKVLGTGEFITLIVSAILYFGVYGLVLLVTKEEMVMEVWQMVMKWFRKLCNKH